MSDISTLWDTARGDWSRAGADLANGNDLITAVLISLFSDRVAQTDDVIPDGSKDLRGWWGDTPPVPLGSRLWLIERAKKTQATLGAAQGYIEEALQWMISDGICSRIDVYCEWTRQNTLGARITAYPIGNAPIKVQTQNIFGLSQVQAWGWNAETGAEWEPLLFGAPSSPPPPAPLTPTFRRREGSYKRLREGGGRRQRETFDA